MKTRISRLLFLAGRASVAIAASAPAMAHCGYGYARPHAYYHAPRVVYSPVVAYRPAPAYYAPAPVYYTQPYPAWGAIGGAIAGAAIGSTVGGGNGRIKVRLRADFCFPAPIVRASPRTMARCPANRPTQGLRPIPFWTRSRARACAATGGCSR